MDFGSIWGDIQQWTSTNGWPETLVALLFLFAGALLSYIAMRTIVLPLIRRIVERTKYTWDNTLLDPKLLGRLAFLVPLVVIVFGLPYVPHLDDVWMDFLQRLTSAVLVLMAVLCITAFMNAANNLYNTFPIARTRPIKGYIQIINILLAIVATVIIVAVLSKKSPLIFLSGLTAIMAILILVFQNTILSLVASIQVAQYDMVRIGDWIEMPKYNADGDVIDIALHTIKVQNWDKTITTIPTHALVNESFKNWRGMQQAGGRRIMRSIYIDMSTIRFLTEEEIERYSRFKPLCDYMRQKREELANQPEDETVEPGEVGDRRRLTNIGTFRAYIWNYLKRHPKVNTETLTFIVRQLQPGPEGLPLQVYVFANTTQWVPYEAIQSDIFDHLLAMIPEFGLRVFQSPSGWDVKELGAALEGNTRT